MKHLEGITCTMSHRQNDLIGSDMLTPRQGHPSDPPIIDLDIIDSTLKTNLAPQRYDRRTHLLQHPNQAECADMGLTHVENLGRCSCLNEFYQYLTTVMLRILDLAVKLSI